MIPSLYEVFYDCLKNIRTDDKLYTKLIDQMSTECDERLDMYGVSFWWYQCHFVARLGKVGTMILRYNFSEKTISVNCLAYSNEELEVEIDKISEEYFFQLSTIHEHIDIELFILFKEMAEAVFSKAWDL